MLLYNFQFENNHKVEHGFTLIESMVVLVLISTIIAIVLPSYRQQVINNAQMQAQQQGLMVAVQLERWRTKRLSYTGFELDNIETTLNQVSNSGNLRNSLLIPLGSDTSNFQYLIIIKDISGNHSLNENIADGNGWRMFITPNPDLPLIEYADRYYLDSYGQRCIFDYGEILPKVTADIMCIDTW